MILEIKEQTKNRYQTNKEKLIECHRKKLLQHKKEDGLAFYTGSFGKRLNHLLSLRNITQIELATFIGVSRQVVREYRLDKTMPRLSVLIKIAKYLDVSLDYLVFGISCVER